MALLFISTYVNKIDGKGRVSVPALFRQALGDEIKDGIIVYRSFNRNALEGCAYSHLAELQERLDELGEYSDEYENLVSIFSDTRALQLDPEGRITIPPKLLEYAGIDDSVAFVGRGRSFQLWDPKAYETYNDAVRERVVKNATSLPPRRRTEAS